MQIYYCVVDREQSYALRVLIRQHRSNEIRSLLDVAVQDPTRRDLVTAAICDLADSLDAMEQMVILGQAGNDSEWLFNEMFTGVSKSAIKDANVELFMSPKIREAILLMLQALPVPGPNAGPAQTQALQFLAEEAEGLMEAVTDAELTNGPKHEYGDSVDDSGFMMFDSGKKSEYKN